MAWPDYWPVATIPGTDPPTNIQAYHEFLIHLWYALRERQWAATDGDFPRRARAWPDTNGNTSFLVSAASVNQITCTKLDSSDPSWPDHLWHSYGDPNRPDNYDLVIENADHKKVLKAQVTDSGSDTIDFVPVQWIEQSQYQDYSDIIGQTVYLIRADRPWWSDRWPAVPSDWIYAQGTAASATTSSITDAEQTWADDFWATPHTDIHPGSPSGYDLIVQESTAANGIRRVALTGNTAGTLEYATQTWTPTAGSLWWIVKTGGRWNANDNYLYEEWYHGAQAGFHSHAPDDTFATALIGAETVQWSIRVDGDCEPSTLAVFDRDIWEEDIDQDPCQPPEYNLTPHIYKTLRGLQVACEELCGYFVPMIDHDGMAYIDVFCAATLWETAGVGWSERGTTGTAAGGGGSIGVSVSPPYDPFDCAYAVFADSGQIIKFGYGTVSGGDLSDTGFTSDHEGKTVLISGGWTRCFPREVKHIYPKTIFLPDADEFGELVDPPIDADPPVMGTWVTHAADSTYTEHDQYGRFAEAGEAFVEEDAIRYSGDAFGDPTTSYSSDDALPDVAAYEDRFLFLRRGDGTTSFGTSGAPTGGGTFYLSDTAANWWPDGVLVTHSSTATGGSTTSLTDSAQSTNTFFTEVCGRFVGFVIEVETSPDIWERRVISTDDRAGTLSWTPALSSTANGKDYRIREPRYERDRWAGRKLLLTEPDGTQHTVTVTASDDQTLFFAEQSFTVAAGWSYRVEEFEPGQVLLRRDGEWIKPPTNESDPRGSVNWPDWMYGILPTTVTKYGRRRCGDYTLFSTFDELYDAINAMQWTLKGLAFVHQAAELNEHNEDDRFAPGGDWASNTAFVDGEWAIPTTPLTQMDAMPYCYSQADAYPPWTPKLFSHCSYAMLETIPRRLGATLEMYAYAIKPYDYGVFDDNGHDVKENLWSLWDSQSVSDATMWSSQQLGPTLTKPVWCDDPSSAAQAKGYVVTAGASILKWAMTYVP